MQRLRVHSIKIEKTRLEDERETKIGCKDRDKTKRRKRNEALRIFWDRESFALVSRQHIMSVKGSMPTAAVSWTFCYLGFSALLGFNCLLNCLDFLCNKGVYGQKVFTEAALYYGLAMNGGL
jgi:hypothetical protein